MVALNAYPIVRSLSPEGLPSVHPAVLGACGTGFDASVYECVIFTLIALMYISQNTQNLF